MINIIPDDLLHVVVLDISGIYAKIHNDGYFSNTEFEQIKQIYCDASKWRVYVI